MIKKIFVTIFVFISFFIGIKNVSAIKINVPQQVDAGEKITVKFTEAKVSTVTSGPLYEFGHDKGDNLTRTSFDGFSGVEKLFFTATDGFATYTTKEIKADYTVTFSVKDLNNNSVQTAQVKVKSKNPTTTTTTTTKSATTTSSTTKSTTTTTTSIVKSNNANLKSLSVLNNNNKEVVYSPEFSPSVYEYSATVDSDISSVSVIATMEDSKANVIINNPDSLVAGENNKVTITVTAEDGTKKAYVLNVKRKALDGNAFLSSLSIAEYPDLKFKSDKFVYTLQLEEDINNLTIQYSASSDSSVVTISDNENLKDGSKVKILVKAEDGSKREYTLNINKGKEKVEKQEEKIEYSTERNPIIIMVLSIIGFSLIGAIIHVIRKK